MSKKLNVKQYAAANDMTQDEVKKKFGLTRWNQKVPTEPVTEDETPTTPPEETPKETPKPTAKKEVPKTNIKKVSGISLDAKKRSVKGLGSKSPYYKELNG